MDTDYTYCKGGIDISYGYISCNRPLFLQEIENYEAAEKIKSVPSSVKTNQKVKCWGFLIDA